MSRLFIYIFFIWKSNNEKIFFMKIQRYSTKIWHLNAKKYPCKSWIKEYIELFHKDAYNILIIQKYFDPLSRINNTK